MVSNQYLQPIEPAAVVTFTIKFRCYGNVATLCSES